MNTKTILSFIVATVFTLLAITSVCAADFAVSNLMVKANDVQLTNGTTVLASAQHLDLMLLLEILT